LGRSSLKKILRTFAAIGMFQELEEERRAMIRKEAGGKQRNVKGGIPSAGGGKKVWMDVACRHPEVRLRATRKKET